MHSTCTCTSMCRKWSSDVQYCMCTSASTYSSRCTIVATHLGWGYGVPAVVGMNMLASSSLDCWGLTQGAEQSVAEAVSGDEVRERRRSEAHAQCDTIRICWQIYYMYGIHNFIICDILKLQLLSLLNCLQESPTYVHSYESTHLAAVNPQSIQAQVAKTQRKVVQPGKGGRGFRASTSANTCTYTYTPLPIM